MQLTRRSVVAAASAPLAACAGGRRFDAIVVGAGVFGAWTAEHLRRAGKRVLLADKMGAANARASSGGESRMTRSDFLLRLVGARSLTALRVLEVGNAVLGTALFVALAFIAWPELAEAWRSSEFFGVQGVYTVPTWPFRALIVGGSVVAAGAYLLQIPSLWRHAGEFGAPA